jgi:carboxymethylenebutenolidase
MFKRFDFTRRLLAGVLGLTLVAAGCDSGNQGTLAVDDQTARDNVAAMAREHADDTTDASEGAKIAPQRAVVSDRLAYAEVGDELVYGYFVFPSDMVEPLAAIIVIHEWWGLNDNIRAMADRLAAEGYIVLAVDLFGGKVATSADEARQLMLSTVERSELASENIRQAYEFVSSTAGAPRIGALGWCFGGGWSLKTAMLFPDKLDAAVIYYGRVTGDEELLRPINAPILGLFGADDSGISVESVEQFRTALEHLRKKHEIHVYPGARHAFANPTGNAYNADVAEDAWEKTLEFLNYNLIVAAGEDT